MSIFKKIISTLMAFAISVSTISSFAIAEISSANKSATNLASGTTDTSSQTEEPNTKFNDFRGPENAPNICEGEEFGFSMKPTESLSSYSNLFDLLSDKDGFDTSDYYPIEFSSLSLRNTDIDLRQMLEFMCKSFVVTSRAYVRNSDLYSTENFCVSNTLSDSVKYRLAEYEYISELLKNMGLEITKDNLKVSIAGAEISDEIASVDVLEEYTYYLNDDYDDENFRCRLYTFTLCKCNESQTWSIDKVVTNDPWEKVNYDYSVAEHNDCISQDVETQTQISGESIDSVAKLSSSTLNPLAVQYKWNYNPSAAAGYASMYYNSVNPTFGEASADCQNFASQCVWAGLGGTGTSATEIPAVSKSIVGSSAPNVWCHNQSTTYYSNAYYNWAWDNVHGFAKLISTNTSSSIGPYGSFITSGAISSAKVGDVLFANIDQNASATLDNIDHAMVVTAVTGTLGSRTVSDIKVAAHNSSTSSAKENLQIYLGISNANYFARCSISGANYNTAQ